MIYYRFLINLDVGLYSLLVLIGLLLFKRIDRLHRSFFIYFFASGILQDVAFYMGKIGMKNHFIMPILILFQIVGLGIFYSKILKKTVYYNYAKIILVGLATLFVFELTKNIVNDYFSLLWYSHLAANVVFSLVSFFVLLMQVKYADDDSDLILHIGVFLYSSVSALVFLFGNILADIPFAGQLAIWFVHLSVHLVFLFLIGYSLWKKIRS